MVVNKKYKIEWPYSEIMSKDRPNIALIVLDSTRAETFYELLDSGVLDLSQYNNDWVSYRNTIANAPWTVPSHGSIFTGKYPSEHGITGSDPSWNNTPTILDDLSQLGYTTVGVSANPWLSPGYDFDKAFDYFMTEWEYSFEGNDMSEVIGAGEVSRIKQFQELISKIYDGNIIKNLANAAYLFTNAWKKDSGANHLIDQSKKLIPKTESPYFYFGNFTEPHLEYRPPKRYIKEHLGANTKYGDALSIEQEPWEYVSGSREYSESEFKILRKLYAASIDYLMDLINELLTTFDEDTHIIITGDHGENIGENQLMDHQFSIHQQVLKVPLLVNGPKKSAEKDLVELRDLYATILDVAGTQAVDSSSSISLFSEDTRSLAISEYLNPRPDLDYLKHLSEDLRHAESLYTKRRRSIQSVSNKLVDIEGEKTKLITLDDKGSSGSHVKNELISELHQSVGTDIESNKSASNKTNKVIQARLEDLGYM